ncbi:MAG: hypothetical protein Kapaf2KO_00570 [Candidatus Kapaibacteriales bacterium]
MLKSEKEIADKLFEVSSKTKELLCILVKEEFFDDDSKEVLTLLKERAVTFSCIDDAIQRIDAESLSSYSQELVRDFWENERRLRSLLFEKLEMTKNEIFKKRSSKSVLLYSEGYKP